MLSLFRKKEEEHNEASFTSPSSPILEGSLYEPSFAYEESGSPREKLKEFLASRDISPICHSLETQWTEASDRTKRHLTRKARQVVNACLKEIVPAVKSRIDESTSDSTLMECLTECYNNATHWSTRRHILSIMADKVTYKELKGWMPYLSRYRFNIARHNLLLHGRGCEVPSLKGKGMYITPEKLDHFLSSIKSTHIVQDLPYNLARKH